MFKVTITLLFFEMLAAVEGLQTSDMCCRDNQDSLEYVKTELEGLRNLLRDQKEECKSDCPPGFTYLPSAGSCYQVVYESHDWYSAGRRCRGLRRGAHLVAIANAEENSAVKTFLASEISKHGGNTACISSDWSEQGNLFWTSGQRQASCDSEFVWKLSCDEQLPFEYVSWTSGQPDCNLNSEFCVHYWPRYDFGWNDQSCNLKFCPLCEYEP